MDNNDHDTPIPSDQEAIDEQTIGTDTDAIVASAQNSAPEVEDLEALIRSLADAYDAQLADADAGDEPATAEEALIADSVNRDEETVATPAADSASGDDESVDDIIAHLLSDTRELSRHQIDSSEYQSLIDEIEALWSRLKDIWPAVQQHPHTAAQLEELWNTLKTGSGSGSWEGAGSDDISQLFSTDVSSGSSDLASSTDLATLTGIDAIDAASSLAAGDHDAHGDAASHSRSAAITESVDEIIARILGGEDVLGSTDAQGSAAQDPWKESPQPEATASSGIDAEMDEFLVSLGINPDQVVARTDVHDEDIRRYLDDLDQDSVSADDNSDSSDATVSAAMSPAATGLSFISEEERSILDELLQGLDADLTAASGDDSEATDASGAARSEEDDAELAAILQRIDEDAARIAAADGAVPASNDEEAISASIDIDASNPEDQDIGDALRPLATHLETGQEPETIIPWNAATAAGQASTESAGWQQRSFTDVLEVDADDTMPAAGLSAGDRVLREDSYSDTREERSNWLLPLAAAIVVGIGAWLLWDLLDGGRPDSAGSTTLARSSTPSAPVATRRQSPDSADTGLSEEQLMARFRQETGQTQQAGDSDTEQPAPATDVSENTFVRNEYYFEAPADNSEPFVADPAPAATDTEDPLFTAPAETYDQTPVFIPPQDSIDAPAQFEPPRQTYEPEPYMAQADDVGAPVFIPPQPVAEEPVQPYIPPQQPVVAEVDLGPLEGALERLRNSTNDSISGLSERVSRLERMIAGLQGSIDSLLRQSSDSANRSLSSLQQIQEKIIVLEEGQQKVVDATIERDGEGYTIIVNNVDGSEILANGGTREIIHIVKKGDTLWHIAKKYINNPWRYPELARLSKIKNPDLIYPGDRVRILLKARQ